MELDLELTPGRHVVRLAAGPGLMFPPGGWASWVGVTIPLHTAGMPDGAAVIAEATDVPGGAAVLLTLDVT